MIRRHHLFSLIVACVIGIIPVQPVSGELAPPKKIALEHGTAVNRGDFQANRFLTLSGPVVLHGKTVALSWQSLEPGGGTARGRIDDDCVTFVNSGSLEKMVSGSFEHMRENDIVYEEAGAETELKAADNTADIVMFRWIDENAETSRKMIPAGHIINGDYLQWCFPEDGGGMVKVVQGRRGQVCFVRLDPGEAISEEKHPGERILWVLRGEMDVSTEGKSQHVGIDDVLLIGKDMSASFTPGANGCRFAAILSPARESYTRALTERIKTFHSIFPRFVKPELAVGDRVGDPQLSFIEGPNWYDGRFYFTDMSVGGFYRIERDGSVTTLNKDILPCGTAILPGGTFAVCNIRNNSIMELSAEGEYIGSIADSFEGGPLPGIPNDIIRDSDGGLYFTAMSFAESPGSNVLMYRRPDGPLVRVSEPGEFGIPNGCALSPDGSILYINDDKSDYIWAYDVKSDGSIENRRAFAKLILDEHVLGGRRTKSYADGLIVDDEGNIYVCASGFVQIFDKRGTYRGGFVLPKPAFHIAFGGDDYSTLYITCPDQIYTLATNMKDTTP